MSEPGFRTCPNCLGVLGSVGCCTFKPEPIAHLARSLSNATLAAEMDAARADGSLVNAWRITDGREVLATRGKIACALPDGHILRGEWPEGMSARLAVVGILTEAPATLGGLLKYIADDARRWGEEDAAAYAASTGYERISFWRRRAERMGVSPIDMAMRDAWVDGVKRAQADGPTS